MRRSVLAIGLGVSALGALAALPPHAADAQAAVRPSDLRCDVQADCGITPRTCCGTCGMPRARDVMAMRKDRIAPHHERVCGSRGCPRCHPPAAPHLVPVCRAHRCTVLDVSRPRWAACSESNECVEMSTTCCGCGEHVAIRRDAAERFRAQRCGGQSCPPCNDDLGEPSVISCVEGRCTRSLSDAPGDGLL